jgi:hypothetical protein
VQQQPQHFKAFRYQECAKVVIILPPRLLDVIIIHVAQARVKNMVVDERTFVADVAGWVTAILTRRQDLPYGPAHVEEHGVGSRSRHDFVLYRRGTNRVVLTGEVKRARFLQTLAECGHYGSVRVPDDEECESTFQEFTRYKKELTQRFDALASQRTRDQLRQRQIVAALMRKAISWRQ